MQTNDQKLILRPIPVQQSYLDLRCAYMFMYVCTKAPGSEGVCEAPWGASYTHAHFNFSYKYRVCFMAPSLVHTSIPTYIHFRFRFLTDIGRCFVKPWRFKGLVKPLVAWYTHTNSSHFPTDME